jgi:transcriptional regulator with XRE-family HTH domain
MTNVCNTCGQPLNRYSPGPMCGSCAWEGRARIGEPPPLPAEFWAEPGMSRAARARDLRAVLRIYLEATGLTQEAVALLIDSDQGTVSKIVRGQRKRYTVEDLEAFRDGLQMPGHLFGLLPGPHELADGVTVIRPSRGEEDPTKRRSFNLAILLTTLGITGPLHDALVADESPAHIGMEHVNLLQTAIEELEQQDAQIGGDALCNVAASLHERAYRWLQTSSYPPEVGDALQAVVGELGAWVGWMAFDADQHVLARRAWQETLLITRSKSRSFRICAYSRFAEAEPGKLYRWPRRPKESQRDGRLLACTH